MQITLMKQRVNWFKSAFIFLIQYLFLPVILSTFLFAFLGIEWMSQQINFESAADSWLLNFIQSPLEMRFMVILPFTVFLSLPAAFLAQGPFPKDDK